MPKKSTTVLDAHGINLEAAFKVSKALSKLYADETAALDAAPDKIKTKFKAKKEKLLGGLSADVMELVKGAQGC